jgi:hypothetical protein
VSERFEKRAPGLGCPRYLRVAFIGTQNPQQSASQSKLYHLARCLADAGHEVTLIVPEDPINRTFPVIRGSEVKFRGIKAPSASRKLSTSTASSLMLALMWCTWSELACARWFRPAVPGIDRFMFRTMTRR